MLRGAPPVCKRQVCDRCGGRFGMITHRWWGNKFCKRTCKDAYLRELWTIFINGHVPQIPDVPISGLAVTLDEAASQFKQSYEAMRTKARLPRPQR